MFLQLSHLPLLVSHPFFVYFYHCYYLFLSKAYRKENGLSGWKKGETATSSVEHLEKLFNIETEIVD